MYLYNILLPIPINQAFTYSYKEKIDIGKRVLVEFRGKNRIGIVWDEALEQPKEYTVKEITNVLDEMPIISTKLKTALEFGAVYYLTFLGLMLKAALPKYIFDRQESIPFSKQCSNNITISKGHSLNAEQAHIYSNIDTDSFGVNLMFGVTGSGKTEVYIKIIEDIIKKGKKAIVLVPEIVLTPQYINIFSERFSKEAISTIHSRLSPKKKFENWLNFMQGSTKILIGTRSAVFADFEDVGAVVVDEENDESYKQENEPRYNAKDIAIYRAKQHNIPIILCSATPTLETYYKAANSKFKMFRLNKRINNIPLPSITIVENKKNEVLTEFSIEKIKETLDNKKTAAILSNRRGFANYIVCANCGHLFLCPNCSVSLTYHKNTNDLKCHWCESSFDIPAKCPKCASRNIIARGLGSQQVEEFLKKRFSNYDIERFDRDSVLTKKSFDRILSKLQNGDIDILVGTQMLSKGHDISKIGLVVVTSIEELFGIPDFRAREKALSLIIQTAGRSGRQEAGEVIIQTHSKDNELIRYIKTHDYEAFLQDELKNRQLFNYPPFSRLIRIIIESTKEEKSKKTADSIAEILNEQFTILGPSQCPLYKLRNYYRYHILIKTNSILPTISFIRKNIVSFKERVHFDVDPISFF